MRKTFWYIAGGQLATTSIGAWSADRTAAYDGWPAEAQDYFWTLSPERQELFFRLRDTDRPAVVMKDEPGRDEAWRIIEERAGAPAQPIEGPEAETETETENRTPEAPEPMGRSYGCVMSRRERGGATTSAPSRRGARLRRRAA